MHNESDMNAPVTRGEIKELIDGAVDGAVARLERAMALGFGTLDAKIERVEERLDAKIDRVAERLDAKIGTLDAKLDRVEGSLRRDMALGFDQANTARERADDALNAKIDRRYSDTISHLDAFMAQTLKARGK